jgi:DNA mismatch repair ATPase MutL
LGYQWELAENNVLLKGVPNLDASVQWERQFGDFISNWDEEYGQVSSSKEMMAWLLAKKEAIRGGQMLTTPEMKDLIVQLLQCENPFFTPNHKKIIFKFNEQNIQQFFRI